jgi:Fe-S oxidoreductase
MSSKSRQLEKCFNCGLCKANCPVFKSLLKETVSPRGKSILLKKDVLDEIFYLCSLCKACERECPAGVKLSEVIREARETLVENNMETHPNQKMIDNVRGFGNPFGKLEKGKTPKELYCC